MKISGSTRKKKGGKKKKQSRRFGTSGIVCTVLAAVVLLLLAIAISEALRCTTILPNVRVYGISVGGMSISEAERAVSSRLENMDNGVRISVTGGTVMEFTPSDTISGYGARIAAESAWNYGRKNGKVIPLRYALSMVDSREIYPGTEEKINGEALRSAISKKVATVNAALIEGAYSVNGNSLTIIKGVTGVLADEDEIYRVVRTAFEQGEREVSYTPSENAPKPLTVDDIYSIVCREPRNAEFDEQFNVIKSLDGLTFDVDRARTLYNKAADGDVITITLTTIHPKVSTTELNALLYRDVLAKWDSALTDNEVRSTNIELAANAVNGTVLLPGEEFSYNDIVGERTAERGYGAAAAYVNGETVSEIGGGICQVSSAVYYCCLIADMDILARTCHLYAASYVPLGMDSTVSWGGPEFKFTNSSSYPVKIETYRAGDYLHCAIYGTKTTDEYIEMDYEITNTYPYTTVYREDESISPGHTRIETPGITGYKVVTYKSRFSADGSLITREKEDVSIYSKRDQIILVAPGERVLYAPGAKPTPAPEAETTPAPIPTTGAGMG